MSQDPSQAPAPGTASASSASNTASTQPSVGNPRDIQGIIALTAVGGFIGVGAAAAIADVARAVDPTPILTVIAPLAFTVVAFYFGSKAAQTPQPQQ